MRRPRLGVLGVGSDITAVALLQGVGAIITFVYQTALLRGLSKEDAGVYFLAMAAIVLAGGLADFGLVATVAPRLAIARGNVSMMFRAALHLRMLALALSLATTIGYLLIVGSLYLVPVVAVAFAATVLSSKATGLRQLFEVIWRLKGRTYVVGVLSVVDLLVGLVALVILAGHGELTVLRAAVIFGFCSLPGFVVAVVPVLRELRRDPEWRQRIPGRLYRALAFSSLPVAALALLSQVSAQLETLVLAGAGLGSRDIAAYNAAVRPLAALIFLATTYAFGIGPVVSQTFRGMQRELTIEYLASVGARLLGATALLICAVCWVYAEPLMRIFGAEYASEAYILRLYAIVTVIVFQVVLLDQFLLALGRRPATLVGAIFQITLALLLELAVVGRWGLSGILIAKGISMSALVLFQLFRLPSEAARGARGGIMRLTAVAMVLVASLVMSQEFAPAFRAAIAVLATMAGIIGFRLVTLTDLQRLRSVRLGI